MHKVKKEGCRMKKEKREKRSFTACGWLLALCWLIYTCSLIGKVNYAANITQVESFYGVSHADAGMVSTFYFFAYGAGQIFNGVFCKKYNLKYTIFGSMLVSGEINLAIALLPSGYFSLIKWLWLVNGVALSVLWPSLIRFLSESLPRSKMSRASVVMGTTTATGTFLIYGLSSVYALFDLFKLAFYTAAVAMPAAGILWLCVYTPLQKKALEETAKEEALEQANAPVAPAKTPQKGEKIPRELLLTIVLLGLFAVATNFIKDGLTTWVPSILKSSFGFSDSLSIMLTLFLPIVSIFGNIFAVTLYRRLGNFVLLCGVLFLAAGALIGGVIGFLSVGLAVFTLIAFALTSFCASSSNSTITSIFPLYMKGKVNSGLLAGVLNGCCYVGSTISSYGLGLVADNWGWTTVFRLLFAVCVAVVVTALVYGVCKGTIKKKKTE